MFIVLDYISIRNIYSGTKTNIKVIYMMEDKFVLNVPSNIEDIRLEQYQKFLKVSKDIDKEDEEANKFLQIKLLEIFCDVTYEQIRRMPAALYEFAVTKIMEVLNESTPLVKKFSMVGSDGVEIEFGMIPNLDNMTSGEYIDLDSLVTDWDNMHKAMAVLYRPIIKRRKDLYDIEPYSTYEKYEELMKHAPLNVSLGALLFFYRLGIKLSKHILNSSVERLTQEERTLVEKNLLEKSGVGINQYMQSLEEISLSLMRSPQQESINV